MDTNRNLMTGTPATGLATCVAEMRSTTAPTWAGQGTALSTGSAVPAGVRVAAHTAAAHTAAAHTAQVAFGARSIDLPGPVPRGAPV